MTLIPRSAGRLCLALFVTGLLAAPFGPAAARDSGTITLRLEPVDQSAPAPTDGASPDAPAGGEILAAPSTPIPARAPEVTAASAVLMDAGTGQVLFARDPHARRPNASTTKIMTAILVIEHCKLTDKIKASKKASLTPYTSIHLKPGEEITVKDLLAAMLVRSANDAAVAAAEHIAGSVAKFAALMNAKAREIGCRDTHFMTPNGLYAKGHYSTAFDLCTMARFAFRYPVFNELVATRKYMLSSRSKNKDDLALFSQSKFLKHYPWADGVKSGYTKEAGRCFVGSATRDGWRLVSAVLCSENVSADTAALMDYGFASFAPATVARAGRPCGAAAIRGGARPTVSVVTKRDLTVAVPRTGARVATAFHLQKEEAPITRGERLGRIAAVVDGREIASAEVFAAQAVGISVARRIWWGMKACCIVAACVAGTIYGRALTKDSRRRRRRVTARIGGLDRFR